MASRRVLQVVGWTGGDGAPPPVGKYVGPLGFVDTAAEATNVRGPAGSGASAEGLFTMALAAEALGGQRVVYASDDGEVSYADSSDATHAGKVIGITVGAVILGDSVIIQTNGPMNDVSFAFSPGPVYFDASGVLTQVVPAAGFIQQVAVALSATEIVVQLGIPLVIT